MCDGERETETEREREWGESEWKGMGGVSDRQTETDTEGEGGREGEVCTAEENKTPFHPDQQVVRDKARPKKPNPKVKGPALF